MIYSRFLAFILPSILVSILLLVPNLASAGELQLYGGANSTTYDESSDANTWGITMRAQYNFSHADSGWIINLNAPGVGIGASELAFGYEWKSAGSFYVEGGLGAGYSRIWGPFPMVIAGFGYRVSQNMFFDFPVMYTSGLSWMPYIGFSF